MVQREQRQEDPKEYTPHIGETRQYWRDIVLGVNDGLVSIFLLVVGVVSGGLDRRRVLLTAIAGAIAGAVSMAAGEYLATKSQDEVLEAEITLERTHIREFRAQEVAQLKGFFTDMGVETEHMEGVMAGFADNDTALLNAMAALEFGAVESERRSPRRAMAMSGGLFLLGSLPSTIPFAVAGSVGGALVWATVGSLLGLFVMGVVKAYVARTS
ncbi:MAG TPA: VIT1/CCC1 transporter family protein, partial [Acidimicrobiia bacterium]|nr:VIT1/CCC1 transporter family protein [Acidimicrobiia bacterium]